jgi:acyl phosphate:glycerol-3-phosphate acyltransferase
LEYAEYAALIVFGYLLGAIPSGLIAGKLLKGIDIRRYGSGGTGATNTLRTLGRWPSAAVFLADALKAALPVLIARALVGVPAVEVAVAMAAIVGHNWPAYVGWKGGRGVSSSFGALLVFSPVAAVGAIVVFVGVIALSRYVSLGSLASSVVGGILLLLLVAVAGFPVAYAAYAVLGAGLIVVQHRGNIGRLLNGTERKLGQKAELTSH